MELVNVVNKFKNHKSTDCDDIDMTLVKNIIDSIVKPLTHIFNQSLLTGHFHLQKWRQALFLKL